MRIALAQINPTVGALAQNSAKILDFVTQAKSKQADIVAFPELALCGYPPEDLLHKEHFVKDNVKALQSLAKKIDGIVAIIGFVDMDAKHNLYNAAAIIANRTIKSIYRKEALPNYGVFDEKRYFKSGDDDQKIYALNGTAFAVNICEDIWVKDGTFLKQNKMGAKLFINISSSPYDTTKFERRAKILKQRAKQTKSHFCYVNLVGGQDELIFDGRSLAVDAKGKILGLGKAFEEDLVLIDLSIGKTKIKKSSNVISLGSLKDKQNKTLVIAPKLQKLSSVELIYKALVLGTRDYVQKNGFKKAVIGLSGGVDSAVVAALAVEALGRENVIGVSMPSKFSSEGTKTDAKQLATNLGIQFLEIPINDIFKVYLQTLGPVFAGQSSDTTEENLQARIRGNILMALSNKFGWIVLTTGNKSEIAVGYCTLYGDMSGGFAVIKDILKTKVYELSEFVNRKRAIIPQSIIDRPPTAELRENQKDQDSLPAYEVLDELLVHYVERHEAFGKIAKRQNIETVKRVMSMVDHSEYKRRQAPPGIKISIRAFGKDWRLPITNKYKEF